MKLRELAASLGCAIEGCGDADLEITGVPQGPRRRRLPTNTSTPSANPKYGPKLKTTQASAVIAARAIDGITTLISTNPYHDFARALALFYQPPRPRPGIHPSAAIAPTAHIGEGASIGPFVSVGENVTMRPVPTPYAPSRMW